MFFAKNRFYTRDVFEISTFSKKVIPIIGPYICDSRKKILHLYKNGKLHGKNSSYVGVLKKRIRFCTLFAAQEGFMDILCRLPIRKRQIRLGDPEKYFQIALNKNLPILIDKTCRRHIRDDKPLIGHKNNLAITNYIAENSCYTFLVTGQIHHKDYAVLFGHPFLSRIELIKKLCGI